MTNSESAAKPPNPNEVFDLIVGYQKSSAIRCAIDLDLFTAIAEGATTSSALAAKCKASERGVRMLCDFLVVHGMLTKQGSNYGLPPVAASFLSKKSPAYMGSIVTFLQSPTMFAMFADLTAAVRKGGTASSEGGTVAPDNDVWVDFARAMAPVMAMPAEIMAKMVLGGRTDSIRVLDIAAGHGLYGLAFAKQNPQARVTALDWEKVVAVAKENAAKMGVADRFNTIAGSAFEVDLGGPYDVILLPNFLHHFDAPSNEKLLKRLRTALKPGGRIATMEFVPDENRVTPPGAATFALVMLATTPAGDAFTFTEYDRMFRNAGYGASKLLPIEGMPSSVIITARE
jgi:SAM-dependent methyltransferase